MCTANDLSVSNVAITRIIDGCVNLQDTAVVDLVGTITSGSSQRYDLGIWINEDGDNNNTVMTTDKKGKFTRRVPCLFSFQ